MLPFFCLLNKWIFYENYVYTLHNIQITIDYRKYSANRKLKDCRINSYFVGPKEQWLVQQYRNNSMIFLIFSLKKKWLQLKKNITFYNEIMKYLYKEYMYSVTKPSK